MMALTQGVFEQAAMPEGRLLETLEGAAWMAVQFTLPFLVVAFVAGIASSLMVGGILFSTKAFAFKGNRMNPLSGLKRMFSMKSLVAPFLILLLFTAPAS